MVAPLVIWIMLTLVATPPAIDLGAGDTIGANSPAALHTLERLGERMSLRDKEGIALERLTELREARPENARRAVDAFEAARARVDRQDFVARHNATISEVILKLETGVRNGTGLPNQSMAIERLKEIQVRRAN